jgi:subtilisin-like proprotein convertase family protein/subtilisin family serine protease
MNRTLKVFCTPDEQERLAEAFTPVERYAGFIVIEVPEGEVAGLAQRFPVDDITDHYLIRVDTVTIETAAPRIDARGRQRAHPAYRGAARLSSNPHHYLVQFVGPIKEAWLAQVKKAGGEPRTPFADYAYVVRADEAARAAIAALPFVRWMGHLRHELRLAESLRQRLDSKRSASAPRALPRTHTLPDGYTVEFFDARDLKAALPAMKALGFEVASQDAGSAVAVLRDPGQAGSSGAAERLRELSAVHGVWKIRPLTLKRTANDVAAAIMGTQASLGAAGLALSGAGEVIAVADTGLDTGVEATIHPDFAGRVQAIRSFPMAPGYGAWVTNPGADDGPADLDSGHGTHVAGSALGSGQASAGLPGVAAPLRGLAHGARLVFQAIEQEMKWRNPADEQRYGRYLLTGIPGDLKTLFADAYARGARIHSNSWGGGDPGAYDEQCEQLDEFVWTHKDFCVLVANGNDGTDADGDGRINATSVSSPATAKNCISVGASENERPGFNGNTYGGWWPNDYPAAPLRHDPMANDPEHLAAFSSRGPTTDGRIKPELVAPGTFILSTRSTRIAANNQAWAGFGPSRLYFHMGGTSMATPLVAGAAGLVREYLRTRRALANPSAALLKATLIAGARRIADIDPGAAGAAADNHQGFGRVDLDAVLAPATPATARFIDAPVALATGDVHAERFTVASRAAPLRVVMAYSDAPGPQLVNNLNLLLTAPDGTRHAGNGAAGSLSLDNRNNVERVEVTNPTPGEWTLQVIASNVPRGPQDFALVMLGHFGQAGAPDQPELPDLPDGVIEHQASPGLAIPDNHPAGVSSTLSVQASGRVATVQVTVAIAHTYIGDLRVLLTAPDQRRVELHGRSGGSADDIRRSYGAVDTPALAALAGVDAAGDWTLSVIDNAGLDVGTLESWSIRLALAESDPFRAAREPALSIPDNRPAGVSDAVDISAPGTVRELQVTVDITHTYIGDLRVRLLAPSGREAVLHERSGGGADNILRTYNATNTPALAGLAGEPVAGRWTLRVSDHAGRDVGKFNRWELRITPA